MTEECAQQFAAEWLTAWNAHDLDQILSHYAPEVEFVSPVVVSLLRDPSGTLRGKGILRVYFQKGLETYPDLHFELLHVLVGVRSVTLFYRSIKNLLVAEVMTLNEEGQVIHASSHYTPDPAAS